MASFWVFKSKGDSVQSLAVNGGADSVCYTFCVLLTVTAIERITYDGITGVGKVDTNLVSPPSAEIAFDKACRVA